MSRNVRTTPLEPSNHGATKDEAGDVTRYGTPYGRRAFQTLFSYLMCVAPNLSLAELLAKVRQVIPEAEEVIMTLAEELIQQGHSQGERSMLLRLLTLKFGAVGANVRARIEAADTAALERYGERIITATLLEDVLKE